LRRLFQCKKRALTWQQEQLRQLQELQQVQKLRQLQELQQVQKLRQQQELEQQELQQQVLQQRVQQEFQQPFRRKQSKQGPAEQQRERIISWSVSSGYVDKV
jgi:hypothetical protein